MIPAMDFLSCYAIAVNEVNASGGRIVTSPTNGAAGVIPAVLKYITEVSGPSAYPCQCSLPPFSQFVSDDPEKSIKTFLLTAAVCYLPNDLLRHGLRFPQAIGMLFKRGSTISAAEGGCQAEVGGTLNE